MCWWSFVPSGHVTCWTGSYLGFFVPAIRNCNSGFPRCQFHLFPSTQKLLYEPSYSGQPHMGLHRAAEHTLRGNTYSLLRTRDEVWLVSYRRIKIHSTQSESTANAVLLRVRWSLLITCVVQGMYSINHGGNKSAYWCRTGNRTDTLCPW